MHAEELRLINGELEHQMGIWRKLADSWHSLNDLRALPWTTVNAKRVRSALEELLRDIKGNCPPSPPPLSTDVDAELPSSTQQFAPFVACLRNIRLYLDSNAIISDLRACEVRERHWCKIQARLRVEWNVSKLTLGAVWDVDIPKHHAVRLR